MHGSDPDRPCPARPQDTPDTFGLQLPGFRISVFDESEEP